MCDLALLALAAVFDGKAEDAEMAAKHTMSSLKSLGQRPTKDGVVINDDVTAVKFLASVYRSGRRCADMATAWRAVNGSGVTDWG